MKPIVENMGLAWQTQQRKLSANKERWGITIMVIPTPSGMQEALCMPVRKLPAYFGTISPNRVRKEIRERIILYQNECDDVLWNYWTGQEVKTKAKQKAIEEKKWLPLMERNEMAEELKRQWDSGPQKALPPPPATLDRLSHQSDPERKELTAMINAWVGVAPIHYAGARAIVNAHIGVKTVDEMTVTQVKQAIQFVMEKIKEAGQQGIPQQALPSVDHWATLSPLFAEMWQATSRAEDLAYTIYREMDKITSGIPLHPQRLDSIPHPWVLYLKDSLRFSFNTLESATKSLKQDILTLEGVAKHYWKEKRYS